MFSFINIERAQNIKAIFFDVDGIMTDGSLYFGTTGEELKQFNVLDGLGIKLIQKAGVKVGIITGRSSAIVNNRMQALGVDLVLQGREDKGQALIEACKILTVDVADCAYMGDDWPDLSAFKLVSLRLTVPNAHAAVRQAAHLITQNKGGQGAVREVCDLILHAKGVYQDFLHHATLPAHSH